METIQHLRDLPNIPPDDVHIWGVRVSDIAARLPALRQVLCPAEVAKAQRFHREEDRHSSIASRGALRMLLSAYMGLPAREVEFSYLETGKPHVVGSEIEFNVSHSGDWVVIALGRARALGVDIEPIKQETNVAAIAERYFTAGETQRIRAAKDPNATFFQLWCRKEAYVKARGSALFRELSSFEVPLLDGEKEGWWFRGLKAGSRHAAAVVSDKPIRDVPCYDFGGLQWDS